MVFKNEKLVSSMDISQINNHTDPNEVRTEWKGIEKNNRTDPKKPV